MRRWVWVVALLCACGDDDGMALPDADLVCSDDGQCDDGLFCNGVEACSPGAVGANALGCVAGAVPCLVGQICDEAEDRCTTTCDGVTDADGDGSDAVECGGDDCDDADADRFPGNPEVCDEEGHDEDCDPDSLGDRDVDGDGYVDRACCNGSTCGTDCEDRMASVSPAASETCNLIDEDCDGTIDEGVQSMGFRDRDGDLHGDPDEPYRACAFDGDLSPTDVDCDDDDNPRRHGLQLEICDMQDNDCDERIDEARFAVSWYEDADGDGFGDAQGETRVSCEPIPGFSTLPLDCDDGDAARSPVSPELCNALDDDCDGRPDFLIEPGDTEDDDGDGVADARCPGATIRDCDDRDPFAQPGAQELCDGVDNDCDGTVDESVGDVTWYPDEDGDGHGDAAGDRRASCERQLGFVLLGDDCDDGDPQRYAGARETCNGVDDDCDGTVDEGAPLRATYEDRDGDGVGDGAPVLACVDIAGRALIPGDCDDDDRDVAPGAPELCDGIDNDCDGSVDETMATVTWYRDVDGDGAGDVADTITGCARRPGYVSNADDCDDGDATRAPGRTEVCNDTDDDCDGVTDEDAEVVTWYPDLDGDGWADGAAARTSCTPMAGESRLLGDCADDDAARYPGATESCDDEDDDCDGNVDETPAQWVDCVDEALNAVPQCTAGICGFVPGSCIGTFDDCDGVSLTGCETDTTTSVEHCGGCGMACGLGDDCAASTCSIVPIDGVETMVTAGCTLRNQRVFCWGDDSDGRLGNGPTITANQLTAVESVMPDAIVEISASNSNVCARTTAGDVWCWGRGTDGQNGNGVFADAESPVAVTLPRPATQLDGGTYAQCALLDDGTVRCWGAYRMRGDGVTTNSAVPTRVLDGSDVPIDDVLQVCTGGDYACALRDMSGSGGGTGEVWCWGSGDNGQLGRDIAIVDLKAAPAVMVSTATAISCGNELACALLGSGAVWCWGADGQGQLGDGEAPMAIEQWVPRPVVALSDAIAISIGDAMGMALRSDDTVVAWGLNQNGILGDPAMPLNDIAHVPQPIPGLTNVRLIESSWKLRSSFRGPACVVMNDADLQCWGRGNYGMRGDGVDVSTTAPPSPVIGFP